MKFAFYTLGCKVNQYETQAMQQMLLADGHTLGEFDEICDGYIINTCTVTAVSDKKSRNAIRRVRRLNPNAVVGVCGCYAQANPDEIRKLDVDVLVGTADRRAFISHLEQAAEHKQKWEKIEDNRLGQDFEILPAGGLTARTRALLKVEDGCNNFCSYCIIPYARGRVRSMPLDAAVAEAQKLAAEGYREIVINGIEISSWGQEWKDGSVLRDLLAAICAAVPDVRIRLGSLEPRTIDEAFCRALAGFPNLCPQFHLSLQSGSDSVLRRMNRKYDTARYDESVHLLHTYFPGCAVTTDLIVGFPGETDEEFRQSLVFVRACGLSKIHIFPYSRRAGTPAAKMDDPTPRADKNRRFDRLVALQNRISEEKHRAYIGRTFRVLIDGRDGDLLTARTDGGRLVRLSGGDGLIGQFRDVRITGSTTWSLTGELA